MILMPVVLVAPILALPLFYNLPMGTALPIYILILIASVYCNIVMVWSMRAAPKGGMNAMVGRRAFTITDIDPEGKFELWGEKWAANAGNKRILAGKEVKILGAKGLVLTVDSLDDDEGS
jgi:membrane-bound ClpP family serine protease